MPQAFPQSLSSVQARTVLRIGIAVGKPGMVHKDQVKELNSSERISKSLQDVRLT